MAEDITLTVQADAPAGPMPTWFEPSAYFTFATPEMRQEFLTDSVVTHGMFVELTQNTLGASTSLEDYEERLADSRLAEEGAIMEGLGAQLMIQVQAMPLWLSSSSETALPPGCEGEWPTYQTVAPDPAKWAQWEAAVSATVTHFNVTHGLSNVWYMLWGEADGPCFWTDTQARYLETWEHFATAARRADPGARVGGPAPVGGPEGIKQGETVPLMRAFLEHSAAHDIPLDFVSYHAFAVPPEEGQRRNRMVLDLLAANGLPEVPIVVTSWNPMHVCWEDNYRQEDPSWPSPPSPFGCWQTDNEMGASYSLALMAHLAAQGVEGYQIMFQLDDADIGGDEEFPHDWGMRTNKNKSAIRKALYHAQTLVGHMPRSLVTATLRASHSEVEYFPHFYAMASAEGDTLSVLVWSYVTSPGQQARAVLLDMGYGRDDFQRWGGPTELAAFVTGAVDVTALTSDPGEQADLQAMKQTLGRQQELVTEDNHVTFEISGLPTTSGYRVTRTLIDASHNNAYATYVTSGLAAAREDELQVLDTQPIAALEDVPAVDLAPYSVMLIEIQADVAAPGADGGPAPEEPAPPDASGCACRSSGSESPAHVPLLLLAAALLALRRELRERRAPEASSAERRGPPSA